MGEKKIDILLAWGNFFMLSFFGLVAGVYGELQRPKPIAAFVVILIVGALVCLTIMVLILTHAEELRKK